MQRFTSTRVVYVVALFVVGVVCGSRHARADYIRDFDVRIEVGKDSTFDVTETISVEFESQRHGIFRIMPYRYERYGQIYSTEFRLKSVTNENGGRIRVSSTKQGRDVNLKIGDPDHTITGTHVYKIRYTVRRALNFFDKVPEVYWNATGDQWPYPIRTARATLVLPPGVDAKNVDTLCFVGPPGSTQTGTITPGTNEIVFGSGGALQAGSGMTIVARLPAGSVIEPGFGQRLWWFIADWWPAVVIPGVVSSFVYWKWSTTGRDEGAGTQAVGVEFEPPTDLTPAEVGTLIDESCDTPDVVATLVDLAARGFLTIEEVPTSKLLFLSAKDYRFVQRKPPAGEAEKLLPHETRFLTGLFSSGPTTDLSDLKQKFYVNIAPMKTAIYRQLTQRQLFKSNPNVVRNAWMGGGIVLTIAGIILLVALQQFGHVAFGVGLSIAGAIVAASARAMPAKTLQGTRKLIECLSFQRFVAMVEKQRIAEMATKDPTVFGRLLPYAMVLGVADQWAQAFVDLAIPAPDWYTSYGNRPFSPIWFTHDLGGGMRTMQRTFTSVPQSKAGSGGSGFSGGSSGGGFGGGGGGSW